MDEKPKFVTDFFSEEEANVIVFGVDTPQSFRAESQMVEPFDLTERRNLLENVRIFDAGEISMDNVEEKTAETISKEKKPMILGTEHTLTLHAMKAMPKGTKLLVFDAHADLKDEYEGDKYSHACWLRRWCELASQNPKDVILVGVRSCDEEEYGYMQKTGLTYFTAQDVRLDIMDVVSKVREKLKSQPVYISVDIDAFDPSIAPAVKYPEPEGLSVSEFLTIIGEVGDCAKDIVGSDSVEIRPIPGNIVTEHVAVKAIFKILDLASHSEI
jgi:agmatinase